MEMLRKNRKCVVIVICVIFVIGVISLIYVKNKSEDDLYIDSFYGDLSNKGSENNIVNVGDGLNSGNSMEDGNSENVEVIYIHIVGEVKNEGIVRLKEGQRIVDAIEMAGGVTEFADLSKVNLAFVLSDGQKVQIPNVNDNVEDFAYVIDNSGDNIIIDDGNNINKGGGKVNINTANQTELETLTGIGPSTANKIIEYRETNGKFSKIEDLKNVSGIGEARYEAIKDDIVVK